LFPRNLFSFHSSVVTLSVKPQARPSIDNGPNAELPLSSAGTERASARGGRGGAGARGRKGERAKGRFEARSADKNLVRRLPDESASPRYGDKKMVSAESAQEERLPNDGRP
jgi:hypothetical protein